MRKVISEDQMLPKGHGPNFCRIYYKADKNLSFLGFAKGRKNPPFLNNNDVLRNSVLFVQFKKREKHP